MWTVCGRPRARHSRTLVSRPGASGKGRGRAVGPAGDCGARNGATHDKYSALGRMLAEVFERAGEMMGGQKAAPATLLR